jgi:hypothetical protein
VPDDAVWPDATQVPAMQQPPPPHVSPGQQAWPAPPHARHWLFVQLPPLRQVPPFATHVEEPGSQHSPAPQAFPAQQGSPAPPQVRQTPAAHARIAPTQALPAQHGWPGPPHCWQTFVPPQARSPALHVRFAQQGWPAPPQAEQVPAKQVTPAAVQAPAQQG